MKCVLLLLCTFSLLLHGETITLGYEPIISSELLRKETAPITLHLKEFKPKTFDVSNMWSGSSSEFLGLCKRGEINLVYVGSAYASILIKRFGFMPLLSSKNAVEIGVVSTIGKDYESLKNNDNSNVFYVADDLNSRFIAKALNPRANLVSRMNSERVIFSVLKNPTNLGIIFKDDLGLIPKYLKNKLVMHDELNVGRIYLLIGPKLSLVASQLKKYMLDFHENWKDPKQEYFYLNFYRFEEWKESHKKGMEVSEEYQAFLNSVQID